MIQPATQKQMLFTARVMRTLDVSLSEHLNRVGENVSLLRCSDSSYEFPFQPHERPAVFSNVVQFALQIFLLKV